MRGGGPPRGGRHLPASPLLAIVALLLAAGPSAGKPRNPGLQQQGPAASAQVQLEVEISPHGAEMGPRLRTAGALLRAEQPEDKEARARQIGAGAGDSGRGGPADAESGLIPPPAAASADPSAAPAPPASEKQWYDKILGTWNKMVSDSSRLESRSMAWFDDLYLKKAPAVHETNAGLANTRETMFANLESNLVASKKAVEKYHGESRNSTLAFWADIEGQLKELTARLNRTADRAPEQIGRLREAEAEAERQMRDYRDKSNSTLAFVEQEANGISEAQGTSQQGVSSMLNRFEDVVGDVAAQLNRTKGLDDNETKVLMYYIMHPSSPSDPDKMTAADFGKFMEDQDIDMARFGKATADFKKAVTGKLSKLVSKVKTVQDILRERLEANTRRLKEKALEKLNATERHFGAEEEAEKAATTALFENVLTKFRADDKVTQSLYDATLAQAMVSERGSRELAGALKGMRTHVIGNATHLMRASKNNSVQGLQRHANASEARLQEAVSKLGVLIGQLRNLPKEPAEDAAVGAG